MKITNDHNLPEALFNVISKVREPVEGRISVTELIDAPLVRHLRMKHWNELEEDASDRLWALLGTSMHYALEKGTPLDALAEERLEVKVGDVVLSGQADLYQDGEITDWKTTSAFAFMKGTKISWIAQLNVYAHLYRATGFPVTSLKIHAILRDWMKNRAWREPDYPQIPFMTVDVPVWSEEKVKDYIDDRMIAHFKAGIGQCTEEERWTRKTTFAVKKKGQKRAKRVLDTHKEAVEWMGEETGMVIEERPGEDVRCENYCSVKNHCPYM